MDSILVKGSLDVENGNKIIAPENLSDVNVKFYGKNNLVIISSKANKLKNLKSSFKAK